MAVDDDPEDDIPLDPPENETEQEQDREVETEEADPEPEQGADDAEPGTQDRQPADRQPSRGERRFQTLSTELQEQRRRNDELNRRLDAVLAGQTQRSSGENSEQRAQRLALLTPEERITETLRESEVKHAREMQGLQFAILDGNDRAAFEAKATVDTLYAKWKPRVEEELAKLRANNQNVDREKLMDYLIGKHARESRKQGDRQRQEARGRVNGQRTRPSNSGSDTASNRRDRNTSLERRLENQPI